MVRANPRISPHDVPCPICRVSAGAFCKMPDDSPFDYHFDREVLAFKFNRQKGNTLPIPGLPDDRKDKGKG